MLKIALPLPQQQPQHPEGPEQLEKNSAWRWVKCSPALIRMSHLGAWLKGVG